MSTTIPKVPVGTATVTGYGVSVVSFALALVAFLTGDHSQQTVGTIVAGAVGLGALAVTSIGRYGQAKALAAAHAWGMDSQPLEQSTQELDAVLKHHGDALLLAVEQRLQRALAQSAPLPDDSGHAPTATSPADDTVLQLAKAMADSPAEAPEDLPDDLPGLSEGIAPSIAESQPAS